MNTKKHLLMAILVGCVLAAPHALPAAEETKWVSLFNGKDLSGWVKVHDVTVEAKDGNLRIVKGMGWLRTEKEYGDFVLEAEWKALEEKYDSGFFLRCPAEGKPWPNNGWQVNLRYDRLGGLVRGYANMLPSETEKMPINQWVKFRLVVQGKKCALYVNGEKAWEFDKLDRDRGYIGIQIEDRAFDFRNLRLQELESGAAPVK